MARTGVLPKSRYRVYLDRAQEFSRQMERATSDKAWNAAGLLGVHCVISACDALTVFRAGKRWSGQDHGGLLGVLSSLNLPGGAGPLRQVSDVLDKKNEVEYEARAFREKEAEEVGRGAARVLTWVVREIAAG